MNYVLEHYKRFSTLPEMRFNDSVSVALNLEPTKALEYLKKKADKSKVSVKWDEWNKEAHNKAFTVAGVMNADILQEIANYVQKSIKNGTSFEDFKKEAVNGGLVDRMKQAGWTGKTPNRLKVIYDTNLKLAAAQGKYEQLFLTKDVFPNAKYVQVERTTKRHDHSLLHNQVFSLNDPILNTIAPPSAFMCGCRLVPTKSEPTKPNLDFIKESKDFQISPLEVWKPKINKYTSEIGNQLKSYLEKLTDDAKKAVEKVKHKLSDMYNKWFGEDEYEINDNLREPVENYLKREFANSKIKKLEDLAAISGAPTSSALYFAPNVRFTFNGKVYFGVEIRVQNEEYSRYSRILYKDEDGNICIHNDYYKPKLTNILPKGNGGMQLYKEANRLREYGIQKIDTFAFGNKKKGNEWKGYYVWFDYGFEADIPDFFIDKYKEKLKGKTKMSEIFADDKLKKLWGTHGDSTCATFDTDENSGTFKRLVDKLKKKGIIID